ncbi:MAG: HAD family hydrolase [Ignavibacteria bacterium]|nr:HAD family hydrolase [Ignavibacteria bacterium]
MPKPNPPLGARDKRNTSNQFRALLFDFDGTLLDSFSVHYEAYEFMFARFGIEVTKEKFLNSYSPNWYHTYEAFGLPKEHWSAADACWIEEAQKQHATLLPGVRETLTKLEKNFLLGLVTSGSKTRVFNDLERTGIAHLFRTIVTGDDIQNPKPSPDGLEVALRDLQVQPSEVMYVGDALADYEMARAANVRFIGVRSEFASSEFDDPDCRIVSVTELPRILGI